MTPPQPSCQLTFQPIRVDTGTDDETGILVLVDGRLVAILVKLDAGFNGDAQGGWHLEAGFGRCDVRVAPFRRLSDGLRWIAQRFDPLPSNLDQVLIKAERAFDAAPEGARPPPAPYAG